jgi:uncharacterized membrane protein YvbJ
MALNTCPDCGTDVSGKAISCPKCGHPFRSQKQRQKTIIVKEPNIGKEGNCVGDFFSCFGFIVFVLILVVVIKACT